MCQGLGPKKHDEISEIDRNSLADNIKHIENARLYNSPTITPTASHKTYVFYNKGDKIQGLYNNEVGNVYIHICVYIYIYIYKETGYSSTS